MAAVDARMPVQRDYGVCIVDNYVVDVGPRNELATRYPAATSFGGDDLLLLPGLINSHDHGRALSGVASGVSDDLLEVWLLFLSIPPTLEPELLAQLEGVALLHSGVTATAHSHNPSSWERLPDECAPILNGYRKAGIRVAFHPPYVDQNLLVYDDAARFLSLLPEELQPLARRAMQPPALSRTAYFALCDDLYARFHDPVHHTVHIQISPAGGPWCSDQLILEACEWAQQHSTRVQMHLLETRYQALYAYRRWGKSFVHHLHEINALGPWLTLAHMVWTGDGDIELLRDHDVAVVHNPSSNLRLRSGIAPLSHFLKAGLRIGIGLDGYALDDDQDYLRELRLAWTLANRPKATSITVSSADVLHMGTSGGAAATFGDGTPLGRLQPGALADLVLLDRRSIEGVWMSPLATPLDVWLRRANRSHVLHVMVNGEWVIWDGRSTRIDEEALLAEVRSALNASNAAQPQESLQAIQKLASYLRRFYASWEAADRVYSEFIDIS